MTDWEERGWGRGFELGTWTGTGEDFTFIAVTISRAQEGKREDGCGYWLTASMTDSPSNPWDL